MASSNYVDSTHPATLWTADSTTGYYPNGAVEKGTFANGLTEANLYEPRLQPCRMDVDSSATLLTTCDDTLPSGNIQHFHYTYGSWGSTNNGDTTNLVAIGAQTFNRTYTYDSLDRISTMSAPGDACSGLSWNYDEWGNRTDQNYTSGTCGTFHTTVGTNNQFGSPYQYDAAGNMIYDGTHSYTYDADGHVSAVDGGATASYAYDAYGRRVQKNAGGAITNYIYGPSGAVVAEYGSCETCWAVGYMYWNGQLKAEYTNSTTYFVHSDLLGSTRLVTGYPTPSIADCDDYYPFGELSSCGGTATLRFKFTGQERDNETLLDNFKARYVSSAMGRFMNPDPSGISLADLNDPQQLNLYSYVRNSPLNMTDPTGLCGIEGDDEPCGYTCLDYDPLSCWPDFADPVSNPPLSPFAANPASSFIATGPGTDWQTILFGPPDPSLLIINNFGGFPPLVDPAAIFGSICPSGGGTIGEAASNCTPSLSFLPFYGYRWPRPHDDLSNLMRYKPPKPPLSERARTYATQYLPCVGVGVLDHTVGDAEHVEGNLIAYLSPRVLVPFLGAPGAIVATGGAAAWFLENGIEINQTCTAQVYGAD